MVVSPALALDAGFTAAELEKSSGKAATADADQLRALAEACLAQHEDPGNVLFGRVYVWCASLEGEKCVSPLAGNALPGARLGLLYVEAMTAATIVGNLDAMGLQPGAYRVEVARLRDSRCRRFVTGYDLR